MSSYITADQLKSRVGQERFTNLAGTESNLVEGIISRASAIIDGFASTRYQIPLEVTPLVEEWALSIAELELYKRGPGSQIPEKIQDSYHIAIAQRADLAQGKIGTGGELTGRGIVPICIVSGRESVLG